MKRPLIAALIPAYAAVVAAKNLTYDRAWLPARRLQKPVISVGSLSAGGAGKTPVVKMLANLLTGEDIAVDVLSRGYGRGSGIAEAVDPAGQAARFGDEPIEMAREGLQVFVAANRYDAGTLAESIKPLADIHLLDDGFQHRRLHRDLDLVLLTADDVRDSLLPGGNLREPLSSLRRASAVILREQEAAALAPIVACHTRAPIWIIRREITLPAPKLTRRNRLLRHRPVRGLLRYAARRRLPPCRRDRLPGPPHKYRTEDFLRLVEAVLHAGADGLITTAKDAVKIHSAAMTKLSQVAPVQVARLSVELLNAPEAWSYLRHQLNMRK